MRSQLASADIKSPGFSFGIRLPNGLAPSFSRPMVSVSHSETRCAVVTLYEVWISNSRQKRAGKDVPTVLVHDPIQGKSEIMQLAFMEIKILSINSKNKIKWTYQGASRR
jgi:ribosomal protein S16